MSESLLQRRERLLGPRLPTFYKQPLNLVRGEDVWLWDAEGNRYLDCYNNVPHVGHCHPRVVSAIAEQAATLNTHTRYLHNTLLDYVEQLCDSFADALSQAILTCTGSEANDIALRMAQARTGKTGIIVTDHTYHGNTTAVSQLSRTNAPPGGAGGHIRFVPAPDSYRGGTAEQIGVAFAASVSEAIADLEASEYGFSALLICPYFANEGFPDLPSGTLATAISAVHTAGGLLIADEVQPGFGRLGSHLWGHQFAGVVPDIVTLGKPMANGHPVGGVVTSTDTMAAFRESFRYFNTFGGNPVSAAAALATWQVLHDESLMQNCFDVGAYARDGLKVLAQKHDCIGNVRGEGLFFGAEMVLDRKLKKPATAFCERVANGMRNEGVLLNRLGINYNTLKIRPPLSFKREHADLMLSTLDKVLGETELKS